MVVVVVVVGVTVGVVVAVVVIVVIIVVVVDVVVNSVTCSSDSGSEKEFIIPGSLLHKLINGINVHVPEQIALVQT